MKKTILCSFAFLLTVTNVWASQKQSPSSHSHHSHYIQNTTQIECTLEEFDRVAIQPQSQDAFTTTAFGKSASTNWSGYVAAPSLVTPKNGSVSSVQGSWIVPVLTPTSDMTYSAIWVGIDGYLSGTVEQIGTSQNWVGGEQQNYAWFEMYPNGAYQLNGFPVDNGDVISAAVEYTGNNVFTLTIVNVTKHVHTVIPASYTRSSTALRSSAEWVVEAPATSSGILPLADFGSTTFRNCLTSINGITSSIANSHWESDSITMQANGNVKAHPSFLLTNGQRFNVSWAHE